MILFGLGVCVFICRPPVQVLLFHRLHRRRFLLSALVLHSVTGTKEFVFYAAVKRTNLPIFYFIISSKHHRCPFCQKSKSIKYKSDVVADADCNPATGFTDSGGIKVVSGGIVPQV